MSATSTSDPLLEGLKILDEDPDDVKALQDRVVLLRKRRLFSDARKLLDRALGVHPDCMPLRLEDAWLHHDQWAFVEAEKGFQWFLEREERDPEALQGKIAALRKQFRYGEAAALLRQALEWHPRDVGLLCEQAWLHIEHGTLKDALPVFDEILLLDPSEDIYLWVIYLLTEQHSLDEVEDRIREGDERFPGSLALLNAKGWVCFHRRDYEQALATFEDVLNRDSRHASAIEGKAATLRMQGGLAEARGIVEQTLHEMPHNLGLLNECGWIHLAQENFSGALEAFGRALQLSLEGDPSDLRNRARAHANLAIAHAHDEDLEAAREHCEKALRLDRRCAAAFACLGIVAARRGLNRDAEHYLLKAIELDPWQGPHVDLAALYIGMERFAEAEKELETALRLNPDDARAHLELGNLYVQTEQTRKAIPEFRRAAALNPNDPDPRWALAIALMQSGRISESERMLRTAIKQVDHSERWKLHLALCQLLTRLGDETGDRQFYEDGLQQANRAIELKSNDWRTHFHAGIVRFKMEDYDGALNDFKLSSKADDNQLDAQLNIRRLEALMAREHERSRVGRRESLVLTGFFVFYLGFLWWLYIGGKVQNSLMLVMNPVLLGLIVVAMMLPWLTRFKMSGFEADLSTPAPKEVLAPTPRPVITFSKADQILK